LGGAVFSGKGRTWNVNYQRMVTSMKYWDDCVDAEDMEAMWRDSAVSAEWIAAGEKKGHKVHISRNSGGKLYVTQKEMRVFIYLL
jgi:hypothetical protein